MDIKKVDAFVKSIKFIAAEWRRKTGVKGPKRFYTDPDDYSRHYCDGYGNETVVTKKMAIASCVTENGKLVKTDLRKNVNHAYRDSHKTENELLLALIRGIKETGGHINLFHNEDSDLGWMNDSETKILCDVGEILDSYGDFGDEQTL